MAFISMRPAPPTRRHLRLWDRVCCYLDAQPYRAMSLPLPTDPPVSVRLFKRVACFRLMHHRDDCRWQLSPRWRAVLRGEYLETTATLSQELRAFADEMDELDATRGRDRAEEMREKTRMLGRPAPMQAALLPMSRSRHRQATSQEGTA